MEPIVEQLAVWIETAIDGRQDPDGTLTLRAVRPELLDWENDTYRHGDVVLVLESIETQSKTNTSRTELATWTLHGVVKKQTAGTAADTVLARMAETIRRLVLAGYAGGQALLIDCGKVVFRDIEGGVTAGVTVTVKYQTDVDDGYR